MADFGDHICRLSVIKYILEQYPHVLLHTWVPDFFVDYVKYCFPKLDVQPYSAAKEKYNSKLTGIKGGGWEHTSIKTHLIDHAFHVLVDRQVGIEHKNYVQINTESIDISKFDLPKDYVVIPTGFTAAVREFSAPVVDGIVDYLLSKSLTPVFLGNKQAITGNGLNIDATFRCDYSKGIDLIGKTSLLEAHHILSKSKAAVGLDNGLLHVAGMTQIPIVMGLTTLIPEHRLPYRNNILGWNTYVVQPPASLKCRGCQSNFNFVYEHDFRTCFYVNIKLDTKIRCVEQLTAALFIEQMEKFL